MQHAPRSEKEYQEFVKSLYCDFPVMLAWQHSVTEETLYTGFCAEPQWLPSIRKLLEDLVFLNTINSIDLPVFRDFKSKRGLLSIHWDGGCHLCDELIDALEASINAL